MTKQSLLEAIKRLIIKRAEAHGNPVEQDRINIKLSRLYDFMYLVNQQEQQRAS